VNQESTEPSAFSRSRWRHVISAIIVLHLAAVFVPPFAFATSNAEGASPLAALLMRSLRPYIDVLFLDHGYAFFAPNPGPSHLIRYSATTADQEPEVQLFPNLERQWPRLMYHRYFMLSEQLHADYTTPEDLAPKPPEGIPNYGQAIREWGAGHAAWERRRAIYELKWNAFENHLKHLHNADRVEMVRVEHLLPSLPEVRDGRIKLTDESLYIDLPEDPGAFAPPPSNANAEPAGQPQPPPTGPLILRPEHLQPVPDNSPTETIPLGAPGEEASP